MVDWGKRLIQARSLGIKEAEFWRLTPFQWYIENQASIEKIKIDNLINIRTYNVVKNIMSQEPSIENFDDIFGIINEDEWNGLGIDDFDSLEEYNEYMETEYIPWAKERGRLE